MSTTNMPATVTAATVTSTPSGTWITTTIDGTYAYSYSLAGTYGGANIGAPATDAATIYMPSYDPDAPVDYRHQTAQLAAICVLLGLTVVLMIGRTWYRGKKLKRWRADDKWIMASLVLTIFPLWVCQLGAFASGSGLKAENIKPEWDYRHFVFSWGWSVSYLVSAMVRVSVCACLLDILPHSFTKMRRFTYALCAVLLAMAVALGLIWLFQYRPFLANFLYSVAAEYWMPMDPPRYFWCAMNIPIDIGIISIPYMIITKTKLKPHERIIIFLVFAAQGMGTIVSAFGIYGVYLNRASLTQEIMWNESIWLVLMDAEIFAYTLGATFPMFSRYFILKAAPSESQQHSDQHSWFRAAASSFSRYSPWTRSQTTKNSGSYDEMSGGTRRKSSGRKPSSESSEKLDAIPMGQVNDRSPQSDDIEWGKTIWIQTDVSLDSATRGNSEEYIAPQTVPKPPKLYSAFEK